MTASPALLIDVGGCNGGRVQGENGYDRAKLVEYVHKPKTSFGDGRFNMLLVGVHNYLAETEEKFHYMGFEQQRLGELFRLHNTYFRGYGPVVNGTFDPRSRLHAGSILDPAKLKAGLYAAYVKRLQQRVLPLLDWHLKHHVFAGETASYTLYVLNDSIDAFPGGAVTQRLIPGSAFTTFGKTKGLRDVWRATRRVPEIAAAERAEEPVEVRIPEQLRPGRYTMELILTSNDREIARNSYPFYIGTRRQPRLGSSYRIALYEAPLIASTGTSLSRILRELGVPFTAIRSFAHLPNFHILVMAPDSIDDVVTRNGKGIHDWIGGGGRLLCMEQKEGGPYPFLTQVRRIAVPGLHVAEPVVTQHPIFAGIDNIKDWDTLNGNRGLVYQACIEPVSESVLLLGGIAIGHGSLHRKPGEGLRFGMVLSENKEGRGLCILSQVLAVSRYWTDPVARKYVQQLLAYTLSPEAGKDARAIDGDYEPPEVRGGLSQDDVFFVDLSKHCNRAFKDDTTSDGKAGWDGGGPDNDMRSLPIGVQTMAGVPFNILDPRQNDNRTCIVLGGGKLPLTEEARGILVRRKAKALHFLHTHGYGGDKDAFANYIVHYAGGATAKIPLISGKNTNGWWGSAPIEDGAVAWTGSNPQAGTICLYRYRWANPHAEKRIDSIDFVSLKTGHTVPILVAVTAEQ